MQANIGALFILNVDGYLGAGLQVLAGWRLKVLQIGPNNVVGLACGHALCEFTSMVGIEFPVGFFLVDAADPDFNSIDGSPVRTKDSPENKCVGFLLLAGGCFAGHKPGR